VPGWSRRIVVVEQRHGVLDQRLRRVGGPHRN